MIHVALMGEIVMSPCHPLLHPLLVSKVTQRLTAHKELPMEFVIQWVILFINYLVPNSDTYLEFPHQKFIFKFKKSFLF